MATAEQGKRDSFSDYFRALDSNSQTRYIEKLKFCDSIDLYALSTKDLDYELEKYPPVQFPDISNYLVLQTSFCTAKQMKAWKSMDSYNFFVCGWIKEVGVNILKDKSCIIKSRVKHLQCLSKTPTHTWLLIKEDGKIITVNCDCMAGLAESCPHVGAVLYALETGVRMRQSVACTDEKSKWLMPTHLDKIPVAPVSDIDFSSARAKKQQLDDAISCSTTEAKKMPAKPCPPVAKGSETYKKFFEELSRNCPKSAALITNEAYYKNFIPKSATSMLPKPIMDCRTKDTVSLSDGDMDELCKTFTLPALTASHISTVERETRKQTGSRKWFRQRAGRITASKLKQTLHTKADKPAKSLIKAICYPESNKFFSSATRHGCQHEAQARREYEKAMAETHDRFSIAEIKSNQINFIYMALFIQSSNTKCLTEDKNKNNTIQNTVKNPKPYTPQQIYTQIRNHIYIHTHT
ncbi:uncharacterized protein LOC127533052 isoform X2 [Acanthochromis polyacanthus]|uniref:uncharacterized protein LOC127533052 isoform X2 n=1 Tax=Acanthochromis polyacanthus TaxID=80966 RepID=UPI00223404E3|nr:uncharacterized protein LOC127533052 isoform X2 [Acanthochromis polyacanthus]